MFLCLDDNECVNKVNCLDFISYLQCYLQRK